MDKVEVMVFIDGIEHGISCIDAQNLTCCGIDIKRAGKCPSTATLYKEVDVGQDIQVGDFTSIILSIEPPCRFYAVPEATIFG